MRFYWHKLVLTPLLAGLGTTLIVALSLGVAENFNYDVTERSLAVGAGTALIIFMVSGIRLAVKVSRYYLVRAVPDGKIAPRAD